MMLPDSLTWALPLAFLALPLPLLIYFLLPAATQAQAPTLRVPNVAPYKAYTSNVVRPSFKSIIRIVLLSLAWLALVTATARPQSFAEPIGVPASGRDLLMGIDISGSMRETDLYAGNTRASRMAVVKQVAQEFVSRRTGDRIGLIMFGSQAYVQTPLTYDHETVQHFLSEAVVGLAGRSTAIGDAIGLGVKRLRERPDSSRVLILLTDGANSAGVVDPVEAAKVAAASGIRIYSIGVGSERAGFNTPFGRSAQRSELDEATLQAISDVTGGQYFRARNQQELSNIYLEIDRLEPTEQDTQEFRPRNELFAWPLGVAVVLNVLWALLGQVGLWQGSRRVREDSAPI